MWQVYAFIAQDLIRDRQREAAAVNLARAAQDGSSTAGSPIGAGRRASVAALRRLGALAARVADRAGAAATRLEGRVA